MLPVRAGVAEIFRRAGAPFRERREGRIDAGRLKVMAAIEACRTAVLGGHMYRCDGCGREHPLHNSCRNRHCPTCQGLAANRWSEARAEDILPVPYFHVVFTLPREIAAIAFCNRRSVFDILFRTVAETLRTIAADPRHGGMRIGGTAVLHTWDQKLRFHPHVHVVVPNAGFDVESGEWKTGSGAWLAPVKVLSSFFRRRFLEDLARAHGRGELGFHGTAAHLANPGEFHATLAAARSRDWVVYAKRPFKGPEQVFSYLARYTHRIAISDSRITAFDGERVSFRHRKPKTPGQRKPRYGTITVSAEEFIRRFLLHVLPDGMHRIRYFGILANGCRARTLERAREALGSVGCAIPGKTAEGLEAGHDREREPEVTTAPVACSHCGGVLRLIREIPRRQEPLSTRGPPDVPPPPRRRDHEHVRSLRIRTARAPSHRPTRPRWQPSGGLDRVPPVLRNEEPEPTARPAESALSFHHPQLIAPA